MIAILTNEPARALGDKVRQNQAEAGKDPHGTNRHLLCAITMKFGCPKSDEGAIGLVFMYKVFVGDEAKWTKQMHDQYGETVRLGPDRLTCTTPQGWKDISGHRIGGRQENGKDPKSVLPEHNGKYSLATVFDVKENPRQRKVFTHAFSDKALRLREPLIRQFVDKLIGNITKAISNDPEVRFDAVKLYNYTNFDIIGEITFGEPLGLLDTSEYTPWIYAIFSNLKRLAFLRFNLEFPAFGAVIRAPTPRKVMEDARDHFGDSATRVDKRLAKGTKGDKPDFWELTLSKRKDYLTQGQMYANSSTFMIAGTETTATLISRLTSLLLKHPDQMEKVKEEVLPYLSACFEEALRVYPPVPTTLFRVTPASGADIDGNWVAPNTRIVISIYSANYSERNFKNAK
ncbi:hypothetical protein COCCADRAFT_30509 [Bipolaris zeicola 26-R-13]|uniref:Cytochrome P450 n=1 Tax=Cochliobolus carbonum (strain 26-R-13) TaxID=930089 RepID=W6XZM6_COCC2|nr:uncharacterized protein COCCADRAFT_30509 [Bipolaris zeicola 26-R-13]EUC28174.1 hypothetical protein COCCADRAFT_30509 [Bipolaris zeicola 26-R-13]